MKILKSLLQRLPANRVAPRQDGHGAPAIHCGDETAEQYRARLIANILAEFPGAGEALRLMQQQIEALPDANERMHAPLHEVRYLMTYSMIPRGPGVLVDIAASEIYAAALRQLKGWTIKSVPILALDYEEDRLPFDDASADGVMLCEVLEHFVRDPMHCLIEINRILRDGGFVLITTPNVASWFSVYRALQQQHPSRWPFYSLDSMKSRNHIHAREYLVDEVALLLQQAGFDRICTTTRDYGISPPYHPLLGFTCRDRGETIFALARKAGPPHKRAFPPLYIDDVEFVRS